MEFRRNDGTELYRIIARLNTITNKEIIGYCQQGEVSSLRREMVLASAYGGDHSLVLEALEC